MITRVFAPVVFPVCLLAQAASPQAPAPRPNAPQATAPQSNPTPPAPGTAPGAPPAAPVPDTAVVAKVNGRDITAADVRRMLAGAPAQVQQAMTQNPQPALDYIFTLDRLEQMAKEDKIMDREPWKDQILFNQRQMLAQAEVNYRMNAMNVTEDEEKQAYDSNKGRFEQAKLRVIYVSFAADPAAAAKGDNGKKPLTEAEAKAKAEDLVKQLKAGTDFAKLARENSDDKSSAEKGGDFGTIRQSDALAAEIKTAVFQAKPGEIAGPIRQPNGFYVIRVDERSARPFAEVRADLAQQVKQEKFQKWMKSIQEQSKVTIENPDFFRSGAVTH